MYTFCALYGVLNVQLGQSRFDRDCEGRRDRVNERATVKRFRNELKIQRCRCRRNGRNLILCGERGWREEERRAIYS